MRATSGIRLGLLLVSAGLVALLSACGSHDHAHESGTERSETAPAAVYSVRGVIAELPPEGRPREWVLVEHEAIPDFVGIGGEVEPMNAMTMRFGVAEGVSLDEIAAGDKVAFELEVDWNADEMARIVSLSPLPADTELELGG